MNERQRTDYAERPYAGLTALVVFCCSLLCFAFQGISPAHAQSTVVRQGAVPSSRHAHPPPSAGTALTKKRLPATQAAAPSAVTRKAKTRASAKKSKGFCENPFNLQHRTPTIAVPEREARAAQITQTPATAEDAAPRDVASRLSFDGGQDERPYDRLAPNNGRVFPGGPDTMSRMDEEEPPELSMTYQMGKRSSASMHLNKQDEHSPLYRPTEKDNDFNSAGVYMDMDVKKDLQLRIGGEYHEIDQDRYGDHESSQGQGASVGLRWSF